MTNFNKCASGQRVALTEGLADEKPRCAVGGIINKGFICPHIIVGGKICGYEHECKYKMQSLMYEDELPEMTDDMGRITVSRDSPPTHWTLIAPPSG